MSAGPVLITGASGFLGRHLLAALPAEGRTAQAVPRDELADAGVLARRLRQSGADCLVHLAGTRGRSEADPAAACVRGNVAAVATACSAALSAGTRRLVLLGSAEEYGPAGGPQQEEQTLAPRTVYGATKAAATLLARSLYQTAGCPVVVLRPFSVYGPGQRPEMFVAEAVDAAVRGLPFRMSAGTQARDFVYVADVVDAVLRATTAPGVEGEVVNVGSGRPRPLLDVVRRIWELSGTAAPLLVGARETPEWERYDTWADVGRAGALLGWSARTDMDEGLRATIAWAREHIG